MNAKRILLYSFVVVLIFSSCTANAAQESSTDQIAATVTLLPTITPTPKPEYAIVSDFENFRESYIPAEELLDGSYWNWLNDVVAPTLLPWFQEHEDKIKYIKPKVAGIPYIGAGFIYKPSKLEYEDPEARPWKRDATFAFTSGMENGNSLNYVVLPVFYYDRVTQQVYPVVSVLPIRVPDPTPSEALVAKKQYLETMNIPSIVFSQSPSGKFNIDNIEMNDSIVGKSWAELGPDEVWKRIEQFHNGDVSAFSKKGIVVLADLSSSNAYKQSVGRVENS